MNSSIKTSSNNKIPFFQQKYTWDCGIACSFMLCKSLKLQYTYSDLLEWVSTSSVWTLDLAFLLKRCGISVTMYTKSPLNISLKSIPYYSNNFSNDKSRISYLYSLNESMQYFPIIISYLSTNSLFSIIKNGYVAIILIDKRYIISLYSLFNIFNYPKLDCDGYYGHYIIITDIIQCEIASHIRYYYHCIDPYSGSLIISIEQIDIARSVYGTDSDILIIDLNNNINIVDSLNFLLYNPLIKQCSDNNIIYLICHGQSEFNSYESHHEIIEDPLLFDSSLSSLGCEQCLKLHNYFFNKNFNINIPNVIFCSPSYCTLQTMDIIFPNNDNQVIDKIIWPDLSEWLTESTDIGSSASFLCKKFPHLNFTNINENWWYHNDEEFSRENFINSGVIESHDHFEERVSQTINNIKTYIKNNEKKSICLVSHPDFLQLFLFKLGHDSSKCFKNGEIQVIYYNEILDYNC